MKTEDLALILRKIRTSSTLIQKDLASMLGVDTSTVTHIERGRRLPSLEILLKWVDVCGGSFQILAPGAAPDPLSALTHAQRTLIEKIDQLDEEKQELVLQVLETLVPLEGSTLGQRQLKQWVENFGQATPAIHQASEPAPVRLRSWEEKEKDQVMMPVKKQTQPVARGKKTA